MRTPVSRRRFLAGTSTLALGGVAVASGAASLIPAPAFAAAGTVGQPAPAFSLKDVTGKTVSLADYKGKVVVLEWTNHGCPFVRKHYDTGNMQALQKEATGQGAVWLTIVSSAEGQQGYVTADEGKKRMADEKWAASHLLLDPAGTAGRAYDAKVTPHLYVIGKDGTLLYNGAIDDRPTTKKEDVAGATNFVRPAIQAALAGQPVQNASNKAYGCTIKYSKASA